MAGWDWWNALKLGCITVGVAALQFLKFALLAEDRRHRRRLRGRDREDDEEEEGFLSGMSPEMRRALVNMIDYQLTPVLVDQWRLGLVKVMLSPEEGPVLPDEDPETRQAILASIESYQKAQDERPAFRQGQTPARYRTENRPDRSQPGPSRQRQQAQSSTTPGPSRPAEPVLVSLPNPEASSSRPQQPIALGSSSLSRAGRSRNDRETASPSRISEPGSKPGKTVDYGQPSAPPLYPQADPPSAPPITDEGFELIDYQPEKAEEEGLEECGICMDAHVEVEINECHHKMCCECAKAICCLEGRAPQCPFCRGPMHGVSALT